MCCLLPSTKLLRGRSTRCGQQATCCRATCCAGVNAALRYTLQDETDTYLRGYNSGVGVVDTSINAVVDWRQRAKRSVWRAPWRKCRSAAVCVDRPSTTTLTPTASRSRSADTITASWRTAAAGPPTGWMTSMQELTDRRGATRCRHPYWKTASRRKWNSVLMWATKTDWNDRSTSTSRCRKLCYLGFVMNIFISPNWFGR